MIVALIAGTSVFFGVGIPVTPAPASAATAHAASAPLVEADWVAEKRGPQPPGGPLAYDSRRHQTVLLVPGEPSETWVFNGATRRWGQKHPPTSPTFADARIAFDVATGTVVAFGSNDPDPTFCDGSQPGVTWTWDGRTWTQRHPTVSPNSCDGLGPTFMAYDARRKRIVFLSSSPGFASTTWLWDGANWAASGYGPAGTAIAYDQVTRRVMSFGESYYYRGPNDLANTQAFDGQNWKTLSEGGGRHDPPARGFASMTFDPVLNGLVFFGGASSSGGSRVFADTWRRVGTHWERLVTRHSPPAMWGAAFVYDTDHHVGVLRSEGTTWLFTAARRGNGYLLCARDGAVFAFGDARFYGSAANAHLNQPIVGMARTSTGKGYWLAAADGGIFAFGDAHFYGSTGGMHLNQPVVGIAATPSKRGYWLVARDGGIFTFGDARFRGSTGGIHLNQPIVGMAATASGRGYWLVARDGGIFTFGDARFLGSGGAAHLDQPVVGMAATPSGQGYWLAAGDGRVFAFGQAAYAGRLDARQIVAIAGSGSRGYWLVGADGGVHAFGNARQPDAKPENLQAPIVGASGN